MNVCYDKLWKLLIDKKMKKTDLIREAKISSNVLAKSSSTNKNILVSIIRKIISENIKSCYHTYSFSISFTDASTLSSSISSLIESITLKGS